MHPSYDINYGFNDGELQWIGATSGVISGQFDIETKPANSYIIEFRDLDTIFDIYLNGIIILKTENMFDVFRVDITNEVKNGANVLHMKFAAPVTESAILAHNWGKNQPPSCPVASQTNGQCNINMIRKA